LGTGIAAAFTATIYGIGLANLLMLPAAAKLKEIANGRAHVRGLIIDGLAAIAEGENPRIIEAKLQGYLVKD
jgi:chemotaxis protein MotA